VRQLARGDFVGAERDRARAQVRRQVVVVALEAMAGYPELRREGVQLLEALVADEVAPVPERQQGVRILAELVDQDQRGPLTLSPARS
jgi:histidine ammonia-lyase